MKFTRDDVRGAVTFGTIGLLSGFMYQVAHVYAGQFVNVEFLEVPTEELVNDCELFSLFCQLQYYQYFDILSYTRSVDDADRLCFLHKQLANGLIKPNVRDRPRAFMFFKSVNRNIEKLIDIAKQQKKWKEAAEINKLYESIFYKTQTHWSSVLKLTVDIF